MMQRSIHPAHRSVGFSLMEVLLAMGVFTVGFVAVASIFPAGALMQRNAAGGVLARDVAKNTQAIIEVFGVLTYNSNASATPGNLDGIDAVFVVQELPAAVFSLYTEDTRSYPSTINNAAERDFYWIPLVKLTDNSQTAPVPEDWRVYFFVLRRESGKTYTAAYPIVGAGRSSNAIPGISSVTATRSAVNTFDVSPATPNLAVSDWILAGDGNLYRVKSVDITGTLITIHGFIDSNWVNGVDVIWYAPAASIDDSSPAMRIVGPLSGLVKETPAP